MRIVLVGMPASGKTTLGLELSEKLNLKFIDSDAYIESKFKMTIPSIFNSVGEDGFRKLENIVLDEILNVDNIIISTGGGLPCFYDNMDVINKRAVSLYVVATHETLVFRIAKTKRKRPLTDKLEKEDLVNYIKTTFEKRRVFYEKAYHQFNPLTQNIEDIIFELQSYDKKNI